VNLFKRKHKFLKHKKSFALQAGQSFMAEIVGGRALFSSKQVFP
jgi:hypothetical protein